MTQALKHLILGGARSGKSAYGEDQAIACASTHQQALWYIATAGQYKKDAEMQQRIAQHQQRRVEQNTASAKPWQLIEEPLDLARVIREYSSPDQCLLIDCLTLWLSNCLLNESWEDKSGQFFEAVKTSQANIFFISNEVGSGVVPMGELSRQFVDESGAIHQALAAHCDRVSLVVAGLPLALKPQT